MAFLKCYSSRCAETAAAVQATWSRNFQKRAKLNISTEWTPHSVVSLILSPVELWCHGGVLALAERHAELLEELDGDLVLRAQPLERHGQHLGPLAVVLGRGEAVLNNK